METPTTTPTTAATGRAVRPGPLLRDVSVPLAAATVLTQVTYPLLSGSALRTATVVAVVLFFLTSVAHAAVHLGARAAAALVVVAGGLGLLAEAVGVRTGFPFGEYVYTGTLGAEVLGVPVVVPLAWTMMAYPCLLLGRTLTVRARRARGPLVALTGGTALAAWDLYLDPQMTDAGHWRFAHPDPALPGIPAIPLTNYAGWLLVAVVMVGLLHLALPTTDTWPRAVLVAPAGLLAWTWLGSAVANLAFFDRPAVALWGFAGMGVTVGVYLLRVLRTPAGSAPS